jgi:hypothetical protein
MRGARRGAAEILRIVVRATGATVAGQSASAESVAADSLVLRPKMPLNGSAQASGAKLFSSVKFAARGVVARAKTRSRGALQIFARCKCALCDASQSHVSSAFLCKREFSCARASLRNFFAAHFIGAYFR